jgi:hypothetical protein
MRSSRWSVALLALAACGGQVDAANNGMPPSASDGGSHATLDAPAIDTSAGGLAGSAGKGGAAGSNGGGAGQGGSMGGSAGAGGSPPCGPDEKLCDQSCVSTSSPAYGCASSSCAPCALAHASSACAGGACSIGVCDSGFGNCNFAATDGCEVDLSSDKNNCGGCGKVCMVPPDACPYYGTCSGGMCLHAEGPPGTADCDCDLSNGNETDITADPLNCGACGIVCTLNVPCLGGICGGPVKCNGPLEDCDGDSSNGCETNTSSDLQSCGGCGQVCSLAHATESCSMGTCALAACDPGWSNCDGILANGCETNIASDWQHCGGCSTPCDNPNGTPTCFGGMCGCGDGGGVMANCDGDCSNGFETSTQNDPNNCGACGNVCAFANASEACVSGMCSIGTCAAGWASCDGFSLNGCETRTDLITSCGGCGMVCSLAHATPACVQGACAIAVCDAGWGDCDNNASNGCETPTDTPSSCGACGALCAAADATESCKTGACGCSGACPSNGFGNCNGNCADGCETSLETLTDCGACGRACAPPHATASCATGACVIATCDAGWGNCDNNPSNGCETPLTTASSCGACGALCNDLQGPETCLSGICGCGCAPGLGNCDKTCTNGCEAQLNTLGNCGGCNQRCNLSHASESCATGTCAITACDAGWMDCDGKAVNGCETEVAFDQQNCGACGVGCSAGKNCYQGACK